MSYLTIRRIILICIGLYSYHCSSASTDTTYLGQLREINLQVEQSLEQNDIGLRAQAYYDRAKLNFKVPLRNQDIIGDLIESAKLYKYLDDDIGFYNTRLVLAEFYILEEIYLDEAFKLSSEAFRFFKQQNIRDKEVVATKQLGQVYQKKQDYEKAIPYIEQALSASIEIKDRTQELDIRVLIIELFGKLGKVEKVVEQGLYTIKLEDKYGLIEKTPEIYHIMASNLYMDGQYEQSLEYAQQAESLLRYYDELAIDNYSLLSKLYENLGQYETAYKASKAAGVIRQEIYSQEKYAMSNQLAVKYQTYERERGSDYGQYTEYGNRDRSKPNAIVGKKKSQKLY